LTIPSNCIALSKLLSPQQTAEILGVEVPTLANWRCNKRYNLPYVKVGSKIKYPEKGVIAFIEERTEMMGVEL
jgi:hypothetical protein